MKNHQKNAPLILPPPVTHQSHLLSLCITNSHLLKTHLLLMYRRVGSPTTTAVYPNPLFLCTSQKQLHYRQRLSSLNTSQLPLTLNPGYLHNNNKNYKKNTKKPDLTQTNQPLSPSHSSPHEEPPSMFSIIHVPPPTLKITKKEKQQKCTACRARNLALLTTTIISCWSSSQTDPAVRKSQVRLFE